MSISHLLKIENGLPVGPGAAPWLPAPLHRLSVEEYEALVGSGLIEGPVHLINGYLVEKMPHHPPHATADEKLGDRLGEHLPEGWTMRAAKPVRLPGQASEPGPDRSIVRGSRDDYRDRHPGPEHIALIAEVSKSGLAQDRKMAEIHGQAGIPLYWIIKLVDRQVEVYSGPGPGGYTSREVFAEGQVLTQMIAGAVVGAIAVSDVLP